MIALSRRRFFVIAAALSVALFLLVFRSGLNRQFYHSADRGSLGSIGVFSRKLLQQQEEGGEDGGGAGTQRVGDGCSKDDIVVYQGATGPMPNGIPTYTVEVHNLCSGGCRAMSEIHFSCGWFSSVRLINPRLFRRLRYNDCLVNDGRPLPSGASLSFQYANSFKYPLSVTSATCSR